MVTKPGASFKKLSTRLYFLSPHSLQRFEKTAVEYNVKGFVIHNETENYLIIQQNDIFERKEFVINDLHTP